MLLLVQQSNIIQCVFRFFFQSDFSHVLIFLTLIQRTENTGGFVSKQDSQDYLSKYIYPEWAKEYTEGINNNCRDLNRVKAHNDLDVQKYQCNPDAYYFTECLFDQTNQLYEAYQNVFWMLKLQTFKKNS